MMIPTGKIKIIKKEEEIEVCDFCLRERKAEGIYYTIDECYADGYESDMIDNYYICKSCSKSKLIPFLEANKKDLPSS